MVRPAYLPPLTKKKLTIGRNDFANFEEFGLQDVAIKVDTGAYTSAIHCHDITVARVDGVEVLKFRLLDPSHPQYNDKELSTRNFKQKSIRSSTGVAEKRYIIQTTIQLFAKTFPIQLSLSERGEMRFPVLLGRRFLKGKFLVDPAKYNLSLKAKINS